ncbi:unnamed protein product [Cyprideis torosa]|uniref:Uncharacterized protein n=1 Tax=Cyprideis torosa TaxID=163714 RepID=A0A7R8WEJ8_9CRUS|nr:unnamed protein product [Cyprideis torosa]CAG0895878.1 unnamed protein product [Cyprideis torosa]
MVKRVIHRRLEQTFSHRERVLAADLELHKKYGHKCLKILVTGATGVLGRGLLPLLTTGGHDVYTLVRNRSQRGGKKLFWDPVTGFIEDLPQFDAVIHLAGEYIGVGRWNRAKKKEVIDSRVAGTNLLLEKLMSRPPKVFLCASAVGYYGDGKEKYLDESSPRGNDFISEVCHLWERSAARASSADVRTVFLRIGVSLSPTGGALQRLLSTAPLGLIRRFGDGKQYISWVSQEDTIGAVYHAMCCEDLSGPVNIVAPQPVSNETFMQELAKISGYPLLFPLPASLLKTLYGQMAEEILLSGCRVSCQKLIDSGYVFRHPTLQEALAALLGKGGQNRVGSTGRGEKRSHAGLIRKFAQVLSERNHEVTLLQAEQPSPNPLREPVPLPSNAISLIQVKPLESRDWLHTLGVRMFRGGVALCDALSNETFQLNIESQKFDAAIIEDSGNHCMQHLMLKLKIPIINYYASVGAEMRGILMDPLETPTNFMNFGANGMSPWQVYLNVLVHKALQWGYYLQDLFFELFLVPSNVQGGDRLSLIQNSPLHFLAFDPSIAGNKRYPPNVIQLGCLTCRPPRLLPEYFRRITMKGPFALFSLGKMVFETGVFPTIPPQLFNTIIAAFETFPKLNFIVSWPLELTKGLTLPRNIFVVNSTPQLDLLWGPNISLFISHCGVNGANEAIHVGVPTICVPVAWDQPRIAAVLSSRQVAPSLELWSMTSKEMVDVISSMFANGSVYPARMRELHKLVHNLPVTPSDRIVKFTEFVLRTKGS